MARWQLTAAVAVALLGTGPGTAAADKSPAIAGVLGLVPGFGAGYWYAGNQRKGTVFAILDSALTVGYVAGMGGTLDNLFEPAGDTWGTIAGICAYARIGSALYQCIDGVTDTQRANRQRATTWAASGRPAFGWQLGGDLLARSPHWTMDSRTALSRDGRELAAAWGRAQAAAPTWQLTATLPDAGLALTFSSGF